MYSTLFCTPLLHLLPPEANCEIMLSQNHFSQPSWRVLIFLQAGVF
jgi:hypothetical protein